MLKERRVNVVKAKLTNSELREFNRLLGRSGAENQAEYIRSQILLTERQIIKREKRAQKISQEQMVGQMKTLAHMHSIINQYKAGVEKDNAIHLLEEDVNKLCHILDL